MAVNTGIQYCDSTLNLQMGCDGCELWGDKFSPNTCYAGHIVTAMAEHENPNFPKLFGVPQIYPERAKYIQEWSDLSHRDRKGKVWLNGYPRIIFLNDMGDTFTKELDLHWMDEFIPQMEASPHIFLMLTKRVIRMTKFWKEYGKVPDNIWLGTSVTNKSNLGRARDLMEIEASTHFISAEPLLELVPFRDVLPEWLIVGFESGTRSRQGSPRWMRMVRDERAEQGLPFFVKQMGGTNNHHGQMSDLPKDLRIRQMPEWSHLQWKGKTPPKMAQISFI